MYFIKRYYRECKKDNKINGYEIKKLYGPVTLIELYTLRTVKSDPIYFGSDVKIPIFGGTYDKKDLIVKRISNGETSFDNCNYHGNVTYEASYLNTDASVQKFFDDNKMDMSRYLLKTPIIVKTAKLDHDVYYTLTPTCNASYYSNELIMDCMTDDRILLLTLGFVIMNILLVSV